MSTIASNAQSEIGIVAESTLGVTPPTPSLIQQAFSTFSLNPTTQELSDTRKTGSRELSSVNVGNRTFSGSLAGPLSYGNYDSLFESAMFNTWTSNVLKVGNVLKSFTLETAQSDIGNYIRYNGVVSSGFNLTTPAEGLSNITFNLLALDMVSASTSIDTDGYTPQVVNEAYKSCGGIMKENGVTSAFINSVDLSLVNEISPLTFWGQCAAGNYSIGNANITGTLSLFFADDSVLQRYLNGAFSSIEFTLQNSAGKTITFFLPRIKYSGATIDIGDTGERLISLPFRAVKDGVQGTGLVITRN